MSIPVQELPNHDRSLQTKQIFRSLCEKNPDFYVRVPGRVNLIGEHIDYCGYGVCPMALEQDVFLGVAIETDPILRLFNVDQKFAPYETSMECVNVHTDGDGAPQWYQYFLCGVKGILEILPKNIKLVGMSVVVNGNIPQGAGLSSSSALVSAAALATSHAHQLTISKEDIADLCAKCERYIGTQGGGMDQAIAFLASRGCAKFIEFSPLRSTDIELPKGAVFVIAHSMAELNKAATADYNYRVVECRLAAQLIAKSQRLQWENIKKLGELQIALSVDLSEMISLVEKVLHEEAYTKAEVVRDLKTTANHLDETSLTSNTRHIQTFKLRQRALHVFREAQRVENFHTVCRTSTGQQALEALGRLMAQSHESLRDYYECSHPQLDRIVELSRDLTLGSRLTGAGWGGCVVSLVVVENVDKYIRTLKKEFYQGLGIVDGLESVLFVTEPNAGACIYYK